MFLGRRWRDDSRSCHVTGPNMSKEGHFAKSSYVLHGIPKMHKERVEIHRVLLCYIWQVISLVFYFFTNF